MFIAGKDICACAATGTGKTAAYMLPILERLLYKSAGGDRVTRVLVLVPTRELGAQVSLCYSVIFHLTIQTTTDSLTNRFFRPITGPVFMVDETPYAILFRNNSFFVNNVLLF